MVTIFLSNWYENRLAIKTKKDEFLSVFKPAEANMHTDHLSKLLGSFLLRSPLQINSLRKTTPPHVAFIMHNILHFPFIMHKIIYNQLLSAVVHTVSFIFRNFPKVFIHFPQPFFFFKIHYAR
jgi:hypothetical protein